MNKNQTVISVAFRTAAIKEAEFCLGADAGILSGDLYAEFARSGNRTRYENVNFRRRRLLNRLALGELCEERGRFLPELSRIIRCTLQERSWVLPAHSGGRLPDGAETNIDLFSSQTAAALAMISARLPLDKDLQKRIWETIDARIFSPFLMHDYWWRDLGTNRRPVPSNWTPWCVHGVLECVRAVLPAALPWEEEKLLPSPSSFEKTEEACACRFTQFLPSLLPPGRPLKKQRKLVHAGSRSSSPPSSLPAVCLSCRKSQSAALLPCATTLMTIRRTAAATRARSTGSIPPAIFSNAACIMSLILQSLPPCILLFKKYI